MIDAEAPKDAGTNHLIDPFSRPRLRPLSGDRPSEAACLSPLGALGTQPGRLVGDVVSERSECAAEIVSDPESGEAGFQRAEIDCLAQRTANEGFQCELRR
jgi:hypothetical protein